MTQTMAQEVLLCFLVVCLEVGSMLKSGMRHVAAGVGAAAKSGRALTRSLISRALPHQGGRQRGCPPRRKARPQPTNSTQRPLRSSRGDSAKPNPDYDPLSSKAPAAAQTGKTRASHLKAQMTPSKTAITNAEGVPAPSSPHWKIKALRPAKPDVIQKPGTTKKKRQKEGNTGLHQASLQEQDSLQVLPTLHQPLSAACVATKQAAVLPIAPATAAQQASVSAVQRSSPHSNRSAAGPVIENQPPPATAAEVVASTTATNAPTVPAIAGATDGAHGCKNGQGGQEGVLLDSLLESLFPQTATSADPMPASASALRAHQNAFSLGGSKGSSGTNSGISSPSSSPVDPLHKESVVRGVSAHLVTTIVLLPRTLFRLCSLDPLRPWDSTVSPKL